MDKKVLSVDGLPMKLISSEGNPLQTDADSGASEGGLGQRTAPDAISGASAL